MKKTRAGEHEGWPEVRPWGAGEVWERARDKHAQYLLEAERARQVGGKRWPGLLAACLRALADRLEPGAPELADQAVAGEAV